jgi:hypothetical protein
VHGPVQLAVAAPIEPHSLNLPRAGRNRRHSGQGREGVGSPEAAHIAGLCDKPGDSDWSRARQRQERMTSHEGLDPMRKRGALPLIAKEAVEERSGELTLNRCVAPEEAPNHRPMTSRN